MTTLIFTIYVSWLSQMNTVSIQFESPTACDNAKLELVHAYSDYTLSKYKTELLSAYCVSGKYGSIN
jgi:hypothetical protein